MRAGAGLPPASEVANAEVQSEYEEVGFTSRNSEFVERRYSFKA